MKTETMCVGDIRTVTFGGETKRVVIWQAYDVGHYVVVPTHHYVSSATQWDLIVDPEDSGLKSTIIVQTDLQAPVYEHALSRELLGFIDFESLRVMHGPDLLVETDPRWDFKIREGKTCRAIGTEVITKLFMEDNNNE